MASDVLIGSTLAGYRVERELARGGMGVVYRAHDPELQRRVCVKLIAPELAADPSFRERFLHEIAVAAALEHPHVCPVYRGGEEQGELYVAMRLLEGGSLAEKVASSGPLAPVQAGALLSQLASALDHAHSRGLLHRDVKPENVLLDAEGNAYLVDFGLAGEASAEGEPALLGGTAAYLAPERCKGEPALPASDLYALACLAHFLLTGAPPFPREHEAALLYAHLRESPPSLAEHGLARLDPVLHQALAKDPSERHESCSAFAEELARALAHPEPSGLEAWPETLPRPVTRFLGRRRELAELSALLVDPDTRLVTLTGPGGAGKTRLALHAAAEAAASFAEGVRFCALAPLRDPQHVISQLAQALGVPEQPPAPLRDSVAEALIGRELLLVLDNAEHLLPALVDDVAFLRDLEHGPTLLVTSRERLDLQTEQLYAVPALADDEGVALFEDRARLANPAFDAGDPALPELCARLDSLPLALELAAARADLYSPSELLQALAGHIELLKGTREHDPRHRTLEQTIAWSYDLLTAEEQRSFRALSVFAGGCTARAAADVARADLPLLHSLLAKSLLRTRETPFGRRYWMLETVREYASERLTRSGEEEDVVRTAVQLATPEMEEIGDLAEIGESPEWRSRVASEFNTVNALVLRAGRLGLAEEALELACAVSFPLREAGRLRDAYDVLLVALQLAGDAPRPLRARALDGAATVAIQTGEQTKALALGQEALALCEEAGDVQRKLRVLGNLGTAASEAGDFTRAESYLSEQLELARSLGVGPEEARALYNLGLLALRVGDPRAAVPRLAAALDLAEQAGHTPGRVYCMVSLGRAQHELGDPRESIQLLSSSLRLIRETGHDAMAPIALEELAALAAEGNQPGLAAPLLRTSDFLREESGSRNSDVEAERVEATRVQVAAELDALDLDAPLDLGQCLELAEELAAAVASRPPR